MTTPLAESPEAQWSAAFVAAQAEMPDIEKRKTATIQMKQGGKFSYKYADLPEIIRVVRPILKKHGLAFAQSVEKDGAGIAVYTRIFHVGGHFEAFGPVVLPSGDDARTAGSAATYGRRYGLCAALGIAADEDTDAEAVRAQGTGADDGGSRPVDTTILAGPPQSSAEQADVSESPLAYGEGVSGSQESTERAEGEPGDNRPPSSRRPTCPVNGTQHKRDSERTLKAREGFEVCACGAGKPMKQESQEWAA